jgi:hypothetical protein
MNWKASVKKKSTMLSFNWTSFSSKESWFGNFCDKENKEILHRCHRVRD